MYNAVCRISILAQQSCIDIRRRSSEILATLLCAGSAAAAAVAAQTVQLISTVNT